LYPSLHSIGEEILYTDVHLFRVTDQRQHRMTIAILTIGDELCLGQIINTNAAWIAEQCSLQGWRVLQHSVVGDEMSVILTEFDRLLHAADVLLITGGLGPTHDDRTKTALVDYLGDTLVMHEPTRLHVEEIFRKRGREVNERTATQALLPATCTPLQNDKGTAAGMWFSVEKSGKTRIIAAMPGVPHEMKHLLTDRILPRLHAHAVATGLDGETMLYATLVTTGIIETDLASLIAPTDAELEAFLEEQELAFLPSAAGVRLRITVTKPSRAEAETTLARLEHKIRSRVGRFVISSSSDAGSITGSGSEMLAVLAGRMLTEQGWTVAVAESCTGGLLGAALTAAAGSSAYFLGGVQCYSNEAKTRLVGVLPETIAAHGAVSEQVAAELAANIRTSFGADYGVSITGIAGPGGGSDDKPVGTVWIGLATPQGCTARHYVFGTDRTFNRDRAVATALLLLVQDVQHLHNKQ
jgi:nicotinamide-nucleotide amidase